MLKIIKWEFGTENKIYSTDLCGKKWMVSKGQWKGLMFSISGLGLSKAERDLLEIKFLQYRGHLTIYFFKWLLSWNSKGIEDILKYVHVIYNKPVKFIVKDYFINFRKRFNTKRDNLLRKIKFNKQYNFTMYRSWEGEYSFTSDMLSAFQLASNYEADLFLNGRYLLSPLGFEWGENNRLVKKYTGLKWKNLGYKDLYDKEIKNYKRMPHQFVTV
jgi:hypothetical protein